MIFTETPLSGAYIVDMDRVQDDRGFFGRSYCAAEFESRGLIAPTNQCSVSFNARKGTLRGMHYQTVPHDEEKLVRCTAGAVFDVILDARPESPTFRHWFGTELTAKNHRSLYVPKGIAHGFISLADDSEILYMMSVPYAASFARGLRWNDPAFGIRWPIQPTVISARDSAYPLQGPSADAG